MSDQFLGEIRMVGFTFAPVGWLQCNGQILAISQFAALFALLGTTYGGNGVSTFQLPNLQGRVPVHAGQSAGTSNYVLGEVTGSESVTLASNQMPIHSHALNCVNNSVANATGPNGNLHAAAFVPRAGGGTPVYANGIGADSTMAATSISTAGGSTPVNIVQPVLCVNFIISTVGIFPARN